MRALLTFLILLTALGARPALGGLSVPTLDDGVAAGTDVIFVAPGKGTRPSDDAQQVTRPNEPESSRLAFLRLLFLGNGSESSEISSGRQSGPRQMTVATVSPTVLVAINGGGQFRLSIPPITRLACFPDDRALKPIMIPAFVPT